MDWLIALSIVAGLALIVWAIHRGLDAAFCADPSVTPRKRWQGDDVE